MALYYYIVILSCHYITSIPGRRNRAHNRRCPEKHVRAALSAVPIGMFSSTPYPSNVFNIHHIPDRSIVMGPVRSKKVDPNRALLISSFVPGRV